LRRDAIEIATVLLKILFVVCEVRLTLLQERLGIPQRQPEKLTDLVARERAVAIASSATASSAPRDTSGQAVSKRFAMSSGKSTAIRVILLISRLIRP
jgi:hypothetical protein